MQIHGSFQVHGPQAIQQPHAVRPTVAPSVDGGVGVRDELSLSGVSSLVEQASQLPEIRQDRVAALRQAIADGSYETADKLDLALERLLDELV